MKRSLLLRFALCSALASLAGAQVLSEDFEGPLFPPAGWTVLDNTGNGGWETSNSFPRGNLTYGSGECAAIDSRYYGYGMDIDTELITPVLTIPDTGYFLEFEHHMNYLFGEISDVDVSVNGGAWTNIATYPLDTTTLESFDLSAYAGASLQIRWHYYQASDDLWWHIDDVKVYLPPPPPSPIWVENFDGGVFPPTGWTVTDTVGNGTWDLSSAFPKGNNSGGTGECAAFDSDAYGTSDVGGELITMPFDIPPSGCSLQFVHRYRHYTAESGDVDIRVGGGPWTNLASYTADVIRHESFDLTAYSGMTGVQIRFHYHDANYAWYWHVDDVGIYSNIGPGTPYCHGDGIGIMCPCGNTNDGSGGLGGCDWGNPLFRGGGALTAYGSSSVLAGDTYLVANAVENSFGIFVEANNQINGGNGRPLGDGLRCAGGRLVRLTTPVVAVDNSATMSSSLQVLGSAVPGSTKRYQYWFLTPSGPCGAGANLTNGYEIVWGP